MHKLAGEDGDAVVYLDPDTAVFAPLDDVEEMSRFIRWCLRPISYNLNAKSRVYWTMR